MAKLFNTRMELLALRSMCSPRREVSGHLLASLNESFFHTEACTEALALIHKEFRDNSTVPNFKQLVEDIRLSDTSRELLVEADAPVKDIAGAKSIVSSLSRLRKVRLVYLMARDAMEKIEKSKVDEDDLLEGLSSQLTQIHASHLTEADVITFGENGNALEMVHEVLFGENNDAVIPTGFNTWDNRNGGFFRGSLVVLGGASGAGKSILANQLSKNQAEIGYNVDIVPLEMSGQEMVSRTISSESGFNSIDINLQRLSTNDKTLAYKRMRRFNRRIASSGGRLTIFKPRQDMSMEELIAALNSMNSDIMYLDYISLLKGVGGDDAWQKLGEVARIAKLHAEHTNKVMVLLAQVSEEGKIRYSQAIREHASVMWTFVATEESREKGFLHIDTGKSRNQIKFPFTLKIKYATTSVSDLSPEELQTLDNEKAARQSARKSNRRAAPITDETSTSKPTTESSDEDMLPDLT